MEERPTKNQLAADLAKPLSRNRARHAKRTRRAAGPKQAPSLAKWSAEARALVAELRRDLAAWTASPAAATFRAAVASEGIAGIKRHFDALMAGPMFERTRRLAADVSIGDIPFPVKAVSIGAALQLDFFLGGYGSAGYAVDLSDLDSVDALIENSVVYYAEAVDEGIDAGADIALQVGLWGKTVEDVQGYYWGVELEVDDGGGVAGIGLATDEEGLDLAAVLIDVTAGVDDGVDGMEFWVQTQKTTNPVAQPTASHMLILTELVCVDQNSVSGHDEVYMTFVPDSGVVYRYPTWNYYAMTEDTSAPEQKWAVGRSVWFDTKVDVYLWDGNDSLGNFTFEYSKFSGPGATQTLTSTRSNGLNEIQYQMTALLVDLNA